MLDFVPNPRPVPKTDIPILPPAESLPPAPVPHNAPMATFQTPFPITGPVPQKPSDYLGDDYADDCDDPEFRFTVTAAMRRFAQVMCSKDCPDNDLDRCRLAKVSVRRLGIWRRKPEFDPWLNSEIRLILSRRMAEVWIELLDLTKEGNVHAARLLVEEFSKSPQNAEKPMTFLARVTQELAYERQARLRKERKRVKPRPKSAETCKPDIGATNA